MSPRFHLLAALTAALTLSLSIPVVARADSLDAGKQLYHQLDYPSARMELIKAASLSDPHRRAEAYLYLGLINMVDGDETAAKQNFRAAALLDKTLQLPTGTSPKVRRAFDEVTVQLAREEQAAPTQPTPPPQPVLIQPAPPPQPAQHSVTIVPIPEPHAAAPPPTSHPVWIPIAFLIAGAAATAVGIAFGAQERASESTFNTAGQNQTVAINARSSANTQAIVADVCFAGAAALAITGGAIWISF